MKMQLFAEMAIMTQCEQGKPDKNDNPRCYLTFVVGQNEFQALIYGTVEDVQQPPVPLNYTFEMSSRVYSNNTNLTIEHMHVDDPLKIGAYYVKSMETANGKK